MEASCSRWRAGPLQQPNARFRAAAMALAAVDVLKGTAEALAQTMLALQGEAANAAPPAAVSIGQKCEAMGRILSGCYEKVHECSRMLRYIEMRQMAASMRPREAVWLMKQPLKAHDEAVDAGWLKRQWKRTLEELLTATQARLGQALAIPDGEVYAQAVARQLVREIEGDAASVATARQPRAECEVVNCCLPLRIWAGDGEELGLRSHLRLWAEVYSMSD